MTHLAPIQFSPRSHCSTRFFLVQSPSTIRGSLATEQTAGGGVRAPAGHESLTLVPHLSAAHAASTHGLTNDDGALRF